MPAAFGALPGRPPTTSLHSSPRAPQPHGEEEAVSFTVRCGTSISDRQDDLPRTGWNPIPGLPDPQIWPFPYLSDRCDLLHEIPSLHTSVSPSVNRDARHLPAKAAGRNKQDLRGKEANGAGCVLGV